MQNHDAVAIVGIGCRFPGSANDPASFWTMLRDGVDGVQEIPPDRWSIPAFYDPEPGKPGKTYSRWAGVIDGFDRFDPGALGLSPREAAHMDPQQRMLLETVWEAFEDSGTVLDPSGSPIGVFIGISTTDYQLVQRSPSRLTSIEMHSMPGQAHSIAANRISYVFNLLGPSLAVDTACSSSLTAVHLASLSLRSGECRAAVAGGVNFLLVPDAFIGFSRMAMLSPDGRCKAFDAGADGFVRAEGAGIVVLKMHSQALADGDRVYALILASAANQDGHTNGMMLPGEPSQISLVEQACAAAGVRPGEIAYVEAHGTGTAVGDPIEARALGAALRHGRPPDRPCIIGSVKTNIGHPEAAAGIAGLIKAALVLHHRQVPPNLHFKTPNPAIPFDELRLRVATRLEPLLPIGRRLVAGVNSFGFGGANAHVVLSEAGHDASVAPNGEPAGALLLPLSARSQASLKAAARAWTEFLKPGAEGAGLRLEDICHTASLRRTHHPYRVAMVANDCEGFVERLQTLLEEKTCPGLVSGHASAADPPRLAFVFSGQGPQWWGMGRELFASEAVFRDKLTECDVLIRKHAGWSLLAELHKDEASSSLHLTAIAQPALFALQVALAGLWSSWGIHPRAVVGHSVGEAAAAYVAGVLDLNDAIRVIVLRGQCMESPEGRGRMLALGMSPTDVQQISAGAGDAAVVAAINSPVSVTLAGDGDCLAEIAEAAKAAGRFASFLPVEYAFHSPRMEAAAARLRTALSGLCPRDSDVPVISTVTGRPAQGRTLDAEFWASGVRRPVAFASAIEHLRTEGINTFLELSPHPVLQRNIKECLDGHAGGYRVLASLVRKRPERAIMLESLGELFASGVPLTWESVNPRGGRHVGLPLYSWQKERCWHELEESQDARLTPQTYPLLQRRLHSAQPGWETELDPRLLPYLPDHRVQGYTVFPGAAYVEMALEAVHAAIGSGPCVLEEIDFLKALLLSQNGQPARVQLISSPQDGTFAIYGRAAAGTSWVQQAAGKMRQEEDPVPDGGKPPGWMLETWDSEVDISRLYTQWQTIGLEYGPSFRRIVKLRNHEGEVLGRLELDEAVTCEGYRIHPTLLDGCFQVLMSMLPLEPNGRPARLFLPTRISQLRFHALPGRVGWIKGRLSKLEERTIEGDVLLLDGNGKALVEVRGFRCQAVDSQKQEKVETLDGCLYELQWHAEPLPEEEAVAEFIPTAAFIAEKAGGILGDLISRIDYGPERHLQIERRMDDLCRRYVFQGLRALGWKPREGHKTSSTALMGQLPVLPKYKRLIGRYLLLFEEGGLIERDGNQNDNDSWTIRQVPPDPGPLEWSELLGFAPMYAAELTLGRCYAEALPGILQGLKDPVQVGFAHNSFTTFEHLYRDGPWCRPYNLMIQEAIAVVLAARPRGRRIRVLELGAGTGAVTSTVLHLFPADESEYCFTDVSGSFFARAEQKFHAYPFVQYRMLDIEKEPESQGFTPRSFDIVLAPDVLHATANLRSTLGYIHGMLAPGGLFALIEPTRAPAMVDLIFGFLDGWWRFQDFDLRPDYPLLSTQRWEALLRESGFSEVVPILEHSRLQILGHQTALIAKPSVVAVSAAVTPPATLASEEKRTTWLLFADSEGLGDAMARRLSEDGEACVTVLPGAEPRCVADQVYSIRPGHREDLAWIVSEALARGDGPCAIVHLWSLNACEEMCMLEGSEFGSAFARAQEQGCHTILYLLQALKEWPSARLPAIWIVTRGAQSVDLPSASKKSPLTVLAAPIYGMGRVIVTERPDLPCRMIDLDPERPPQTAEAKAVYRELHANTDETEVAFRRNTRYVQRIAGGSLAAGPKGSPKPAAESTAFRMSLPHGGVLDNLSFKVAPRKVPEAGEVEIRVSAASLNFRDVMKCLGMFPVEERDARIIGAECAGEIVRVGPGVDEFQVGDEVLSLGLDCFASHLTTDARSVFRKPAGLTLEEAATIPICFLTAMYALHDLARIRPDDRLLIHAGTGGVGLAAIGLARLAGCEVIATAGSTDKRDFLRWLGVKHVLNSRSLAFADDVMSLTNGEGVDVVLNSLAGAAISKGISVLRPYGRFLEIGKRDIYQHTKLDMFALNKNISFFTIDLAYAMAQKQALLRDLMQRVAALVDEGRLHPLPVRVFPPWDVPGAFRHMAQAKHIGKVVVAMDSRHVPIEPAAPVSEPVHFRGDASYLITGGLGGFGLAVASWLVRQGAKHLVLIGRSGARGEAEAAVERLRAGGVEVLVVRADVSRNQELASVLEQARRNMPPLRGVLHAAMVLDDGLLASLDTERFERVMAPKVTGAWNLHVLTRKMPLDFFVLFSSMASVMGSPGQGNYAAANAFLDGFAHYRQALGLPAVSINWGRISEVGYVARHQSVVDLLERQGCRGISPESAMTMLGLLMRSNFAQAVALDLDRRKWMASFPHRHKVRRYAGLAAADGPEATPGDSADPLRSRLASASADERRRILEQYLREEAAHVLRTSPSTIDVKAPLNEAGLDSLMTVELMNRIEAGLKLAVPAGNLLAGRSIAQTSNDLLDMLAREDRGSGAAGVPPLPANQAVPTVAAAEPKTLERRAQQGSACDAAAALQAAAPLSQQPLPPLAEAPVATRPIGAVRPAMVAPSSTTGQQAPAVMSSDVPAPNCTDRYYGYLDYSGWSRPQRLAQYMVGAFWRLAAKIDAQDLNRIPATGPFLLAINHLSLLDVPLLWPFVPRRTIPLAGERWANVPLIHWIFDSAHAIYIRRGEGDREALERGLAVLRAGGVLGLAPEGHRSRKGGLDTGHVGIAWLAMEARVPVVPIVLYGQEQIRGNLRRLRRTHVHLRVGAPIYLQDGERTAATLREGTGHIMASMAALLPPAYRGVYADHLS